MLDLCSMLPASNVPIFASIANNIQVFVIEFITFATDFVPFAVEFVAFAVEFVPFVI